MKGIKDMYKSFDNAPRDVADTTNAIQRGTGVDF